TLNDVSCLLHLPLGGRLLDHVPITKAGGIDLMVRLLGSDPVDADNEVTKTKGDQARTTYLKPLFKTHLQRIEEFIESYTIFADTSKNSVHLNYLRYFDDLELVADYVWGPVALTHLYKGLSATTAPGIKVVTGATFHIDRRLTAPSDSTSPRPHMASTELHGRYRISVFTPAGSDVEISSSCTSLSGSFVGLVIHRPFLAFCLCLQIHCHSGTDFSTLCSVLVSGVDSRAERAHCYLCLVRCA
ncbi:serine/threonine-protein phosphatase 7 long form-like protein, partial [Trifolium medium]|nr:serine/threonine-protein phosphatase 7 long form-like protein [Trifolium medium]